MPTAPELEMKELPTDYPDDVVEVLDLMSFGKGLKLLGSMSLRAQLYAGDYDGYEVVNEKGKLESVLVRLRKRFQSMVKDLRSRKDTWIGDIKSGTHEAWRVIPRDAGFVDGKLQGYNQTACKRKVAELLEKNIISAQEAKEAEEMLKPNPSVSEFLKAKSKIKFNVIRWTVPEVLANAKRLRDGSVVNLESCFNSPIITKMDVIALVQNNRFTDFSVIYEFHVNGKTINPDPVDIVKSLKENILAYKEEGNYFKAIKRQFALAKYQGDVKTVQRLTPILNSDLGRLYHVYGDVGTLLSLLDGHKGVPDKIVRYEINQFKNRLANVYTLKDFLKEHSTIIGMINRVVSLPLAKMPPMLEKLEGLLKEFLQKNAKPYLKV